MIASGRSSEVALGVAYHEGGFKRACAVKRLLPTFRGFPDRIEALKAEGILGPSLQHPNIVQTIGYAIVDGADAVILEHVLGTDVGRLIAKCNTAKLKLSQPMAIAIAAELARALHYLHGRQDPAGNALVHREVTASNVVLSLEGEVKLADFGAAATGVASPDSTDYASPEQLSGGGKVDCRADVYSLGAVLWELLTGDRLFGGCGPSRGEREGRFAHARELVRKKADVLDVELEGFLVRCLAADREQRFATAGECEQELLTYLSRKHPSYTRQRLATFLKSVLSKSIKGVEKKLKQGMSDKSVRFEQPQAAAAPAQQVIIQVPGGSSEAAAIKTHRGVELSLDGDADVVSSAPRPAASAGSGSLRAAPAEAVGNTGMRATPSSAPATRPRSSTRSHRAPSSDSGSSSSFSMGKAVAILLILAAAGFATVSYLDKPKQAARDHNDGQRPTSPAKGKTKR